MTDENKPVGRAIPRILAARVPFYYGWIVLACLCCAGVARQGPSVVTLSIFIEPLTQEFGWSRTAVSGAVSLGGLLAALVAPLIGSLLDQRGSRLVLCLAVLINGVALLLLSLTPSLLVFYVLFCIARMNWAGPFDLGIYGALNNRFVTRRTIASSIVTLAQMLALVAMPLIAHFAISQHGWRAGWIALGAVTLIVGFVPIWLFLARRPEDIGLAPDRASPANENQPGRAMIAVEPSFSRREAIRTVAFWLLLLYSVLAFPVQAGVSLHQAPHLIQRGIDPATTALIVGSFSFASVLATIACGFLPRRLPIRFPLALVGMMLAIGTWMMVDVASAPGGYFAAGLFGAGVGGLMMLVPIAWADYFGRTNYGAIRGIALSVQVVAQAAGPLLSGVLFDVTGDYTVSLYCFATLTAVSVLVALAARPPRPAI